MAAANPSRISPRGPAGPTRPPLPPRRSPPPPTGRSPIVSRAEPGKLPAAIMAIVVHAAFFAVIVFGVSWQVKKPEPVTAELWDKLPAMQKPEPETRPEPKPEPPPEPPPPAKKVIEPPPKPAPPQPTKADIELKNKKEKQEKLEKEKLEKEKVEKLKLVELEKKRKEDDAKKRKEEDAQKKAAKVADDKLKAEQASRQSAAAAAQADYGRKIAELIRSRANIPDTVSGKPSITVRLRLLVNGVVFDAQVIKPSGNRVYDEAVERAINGIRQWPLPENAELLGGRRELNLNIEHER